MGPKTAIVTGVTAAIGVAVGYALPRPDPAEYDSIAFLVTALDAKGVECGGELRVHTSTGVEGDDDPFENGWCPRFDGDDQADFYAFDDQASREAYVDETKERLDTPIGVSGVVGSNWIVSVRLEETARRVQDAIGGEVVGY